MCWIFCSQGYTHSQVTSAAKPPIHPHHIRPHTVKIKTGTLLKRYCKFHRYSKTFKTISCQYWNKIHRSAPRENVSWAWIVLSKSSVSLWICCLKEKKNRFASQKRIKMGKLYMHEDEKKKHTKLLSAYARSIAWVVKLSKKYIELKRKNHFKIIDTMSQRHKY